MEAEDRYDMGVQGVILLRVKYRPIILEDPRRYNGQNYLRDLVLRRCDAEAGFAA